MATQICFPTFQPLPGEPNPPTIDGFVEPEDFLDPNFGTGGQTLDTGWNNASRITYVADAAVGAGRPLTVMQCLTASGFLYLSFVVRRDSQFDSNDCVILVFRPVAPGPATPKDGTERRIDIFPNSVGTGVAASGDPRDVNYYQWNTGGSGSWQDLGNNPVNNVSIKCKSWDLGNNNKNWSVEIKLPTTKASGGANWIDFTSSFGFYSNVIRFCTQAECQVEPTVFDGTAFEFTFPRANFATGDGLIQGATLTDLDQAPIPLAWMAQATLGSGAACSGVAGAKFANGANSIGVLSGSSIIDTIQKSSPNTFVARVKNTAASGSTAKAVSASFRVANWGVGPGDNAKWNLIPSPGNPTPGSDVPGGGLGSTTTVDLTTTWSLTAAQQSQYAHPPTASSPLDLHQCIWVLLDSVQAVDFAESSARRNMNFTPLSEHDESAEVSGDGYPPPPGGAVDQNMLLLVSHQHRGHLVPNNEAGTFESRNQQRLASAGGFGRGERVSEPGGGFAGILAALQRLVSSFTVVYDWVWITDSYRRTEFELRAGGKKFRVYEPAGSFGYLADHEGLVSSFTQSLTAGANAAGRFEESGRDTYRLRVPNGGSATIVAHLKAEELVVPWWFWLLLLLIILLIVYGIFG